ncbi:MAG: choice-of-anchor L domain-containing protein [Saprospirales bacterium]|nr:choice-of-anchor L domain-containing protein [Saprospirales bacterium]
MKQLLPLFCLFAYLPANAQLFVDSVEYSAETLVMDFFNGSCVDVLHVDYVGQPAQKTFFEGSQSGLGVNAGIILTTGDASVAVGPNKQAGASGGYGLGFPVFNEPFNLFLQSAVNGASFDQSVLHITLVPHIDSIGFKYVFASEEYCEYVNTQFNDVFGFLISGPGINGVQNIALVPGANIPVAINNVNHLQYTGFYRHNIASDSNQTTCGIPLSTDPMHQWVQYDGMTTVLTASASVIPDSTYEVWIGISDIGDGVWDSGIFLSIESLCGDSLLSPTVAFSTTTTGNTVTFANTTKYATAWHWDFGDGASSDERFPKHTYDNLNQQYQVRLIATNYCCADTLYSTVGATTPAPAPAPLPCRVFPTRFTNQITIEPPAGVSAGQIVLTDLTGRVALRQNLAGRTVLHTGQLSSGAYMLEVSADTGQRWVYRMVK